VKTDDRSRGGGGTALSKRQTNQVDLLLLPLPLSFREQQLSQQQCEDNMPKPIAENLSAPEGHEDEQKKVHRRRFFFEGTKTASTFFAILRPMLTVNATSTRSSPRTTCTASKGKTPTSASATRTSSRTYVFLPPSLAFLSSHSLTDLFTFIVCRVTGQWKPSSTVRPSPALPLPPLPFSLHTLDSRRRRRSSPSPRLRPRRPLRRGSRRHTVYPLVD
jgi:hypothetical protein